MINILLEHFSKRMNAVSFDDIKFWSQIPEIDRSEFDWNFGRRYYNAILAFVKGSQHTEVSRIFVIPRDKLSTNENKELFAAILNKHMEDEIGFAVAFTDNFSDALKRIYGRDRNGLERNFALLDRDQAAIYFRHDESDRFVTVIRTDEMIMRFVSKEIFI